MNSYICLLFLMFVNLQTVLSNSTPHAQKWEHLQKELEEMEKENIATFKTIYQYGKEFDHFVEKKGLNLQQLRRAAFFKDKCMEIMEQFLSLHPNAEERKVLALGKACILEMIQAKTEYECTKLIPNKVDNETIEKLGEECANEAYDAVKQGIPGSCSHLVDDEAFKQKLQKKIDEFELHTK